MNYVQIPEEALNALFGNFFMHEIHAQLFNGLLLHEQASQNVFSVASNTGADLIHVHFSYRLATLWPDKLVPVYVRRV